MVENEFKVMLTKEQFDVIKAMFAWNKRIEQTNFYFDTAELSLISSHITCRVRRVGQEHFLQMKLPNGADYSRIELEKPLGKELPRSIAAAELNAVSGRTDMPDVSLLGELTTVRYVKDYGGAEIDLDESRYFGRTDHELEIEFTDEALARELLSELRTKAGVESCGEVCPGKVHRFIAEWKKLG